MAREKHTSSPEKTLDNFKVGKGSYLMACFHDLHSLPRVNVAVNNADLLTGSRRPIFTTPSLWLDNAHKALMDAVARVFLFNREPCLVPSHLCWELN